LAEKRSARQAALELILRVLQRCLRSAKLYRLRVSRNVITCHMPLLRPDSIFLRGWNAG
jgi:hypothetical protein